MGLEDDEFVRYYLAQDDWRKEGSSYDKKSYFQCLMAGLVCAEDQATGHLDIWLPVEPGDAYEIGYHSIAIPAEEVVNRVVMKFKIPPAPQKNVYVKQMLLLMPFDRGTGVPKDGWLKEFGSAVVMGKMEGFKYGNENQILAYDSDMTGKNWGDAGSNSWREDYTEIGTWGKVDGMKPSMGGVEDQSPIDRNMRYPIGDITAEGRTSLGAGPVTEITEISYYDDMRLKDRNTGQYSWWAFNLSPMCISEPYDAEAVLEFMFWARYDISNWNLPGGIPFKGKEMVYTAFHSNRNKSAAYTGCLPTQWPEGSSDPLFSNINVDGQGTHGGNKIFLRPVLCIIWKKKQSFEEDVSKAEDLKLEPSELGQQMGKFTWSKSEETGHFRSYKLKVGDFPFVVSPILKYVTDDNAIEETHQWVPMGYYIGYVPPVWVAMSSFIGKYLGVEYFSNYVAAYRPFLSNKWELGPQLFNEDMFPHPQDNGTLSAFKIIGHELHEVLYPVIAGIDAFDVGDTIDIFYGQGTEDWSAIIDKDLVISPPAPAFDDRYIIAGTGGGWGAGTIGDVAKCTNPVGPVWSFLSPLDGENAYVVDESKGYCWSGTSWQTKGFGWFKFSNRSGIVDYIVGQSAVLYSDTPAFPKKSERSFVLKLDLDNDKIMLDTVDHQFRDDTRLFIVRKKISKVHFLFGDGGKGYTEDVFELIDYFFGGISTHLLVSDTSSLDIGDRICLMDGLQPYLYTIKNIQGDKVEVNETITDTFPPFTQLYKCPKYIYTKSGDMEFAGAVEAEDGFMSDYVSLEYPYTIADIAPYAVISAEKLLIKKNEVVRFWGIESILYDFTQVLGGGGVEQYHFQQDALGWNATNDPYYDFSWGSIGSKTVSLKVNNSKGTPAGDSPIVTINVEVVDEVIAGVVSDIIDIADFTDGYTEEVIEGGRETEVDDNITSDKKAFDSPVKKTRMVRLSGLANLRTATHPIPKVNVWRNTKSALFQKLANDLVTLLYLENHKAALKITLEGEDTYLLMDAFPRSRNWRMMEKRDWNATFVIIE